MLVRPAHPVRCIITVLWPIQRIRCVRKARLTTWSTTSMERVNVPRKANESSPLCWLKVRSIVEEILFYFRCSSWSTAWCESSKFLVVVCCWCRTFQTFSTAKYGLVEWHWLVDGIALSSLEVFSTSACRHVLDWNEQGTFEHHWAFSPVIIVISSHKSLFF